MHSGSGQVLRARARDALSVRVGICEDDQQLQSVLARALSGEGFDVRVTGTGREAVRVFSAEATDVLVLDIGLHDAAGL